MISFHALKKESLLVDCFYINNCLVPLSHFLSFAICSSFLSLCFCSYELSNTSWAWVGTYILSLFLSCKPSHFIPYMGIFIYTMSPVSSSTCDNNSLLSGLCLSGSLFWLISSHCRMNLFPITYFSSLDDALNKCLSGLLMILSYLYLSPGMLLFTSTNI